MKEEFADIEHCSLYNVSTLGYVINLRTGRQRKVSRNQQGIGMVCLQMDDLHLKTVSVSRLVAEAFLLNDQDPEIFNTVINLDGDRTNAAVTNLMWRPRWFAIQYHRQFEYPDFQIEHLPFEDIDSGEQFMNFRQACTKYGLYFPDIIKSCDFGNPTFPTGQRFRWID